MAFSADLLTPARSSGVHFFDYSTTDSRSTVTGSGYFASAAFNGLDRGDRITVTNTSSGDTYVVEITGVAADGGATGAIAERVNTSAVTALTVTTITPTTIAGGAFSSMFTIPVATVAAAGTNQATAAQLTAGFTLVTGADDAKGVKLPAAVAGAMCIIKVDAGADLLVYPATGDAINAIAANAAMTVVDDVCFTLIALDGTTWYSSPLLPS